jgi:cell shape-determining protein MreC
VTHIGPTAQDFKKVFGVGENDKSISTIDPSGIALAAIKELHRQNAALKDQVAELSKKAARIDELQKQIDDLKKSAAQTDQLRAQIKELSDMVEMILGARNVQTTNRLASSK